MTTDAGVSRHSTRGRAIPSATDDASTHASHDTLQEGSL